MNRAKTFLIPLALLALLAGCGSGGDNSAQIVFNGQQQELAVQAVDCIAGFPTGGLVGPADAPLLCYVSFRSRGFFADTLTIRVDDVRPIYNDFLGQNLPLNVPPVYVDNLTFQAQPLVVMDGAIRFTQIANVQGEKVCADYEIQTGNGLMSGQFCGRVRVGF